MKTRNDIEVVINNKKYVLSGYESDTYLQSVAAYINNKHTEIKKIESFHRLEQDMRNTLIELNIADDYFKAKDQIEELSKDLEKKTEEMFDLKHELIVLQSKFDVLQKELQALKFDNVEQQKKVVQLETQITEQQKKNDGKKGR